MTYKRFNIITAVTLSISFIFTIISSTKCEQVDINLNNCRKLEVYTQCKLNNLKITQNLDKFINLNITSTNNITSPNDIRIESSNIQFIPSKLFEEFHDLKEFVAINCSIKFIYQTTFLKAFKLHYLVLSHNKIQSIPDDSFRSVSDLQSLKLDNNEIDFLTTNVFRRLNMLRTLKLSYNRITYLPLFIFNDLESLEILQIDNNNIKIISLQQFATNLQLQQIDLSSNQLTIIDNGTLLELTNLQQLNLENNVCVNASIKHNRNYTRILECCLTTHDEMMGCLALRRDEHEKENGTNWMLIFILFVSIFGNLMLILFCFRSKRILERVRRSDAMELVSNFITENPYQGF